MCLWFRLWMRVITVCWWTIISPWRGGDAASTTFTPLKINKCNPATMRERAENESKGWRVWRGSLLSLTGISFFKEFFSVRRSCRDRGGAKISRRRRSERSSISKKPFFIYYAFSSPRAPIIPNDMFDGKSQAGPYVDFVYYNDGANGYHFGRNK